MKKRELVRLLLREGFVFFGPSQRHDRYIKNGVIVSLGRHDTVKPHEYRDAIKKIRSVCDVRT